uniref:Uncharacterized protein n=1 Tax=viral metagenome TaxID=1070528 RepID=A0A6C0B1Q1_9ZZZZ
METDNKFIVVTCPHCSELIVIEQINCNIFRHGVMKDTGKQMDPHAPKEVCYQLKETDAIYGCGKPFSLVKKDDEFTANICEYI